MYQHDLGRRVWTQLAAWALAATVIGVGLSVTIHHVAQVSTAAVTAVLHAVQPLHLVALAGVWFAGLAVYSTVLSAAMPGLGARRSLLLNLSGSAVANLMPLGGAVATGVNWRMVRSWGHTNDSFSAFCILTNALDVATKLVLPLLAVSLLTASATHVPLALWLVAGGCAVVLGLGWIVVARTSHRGAEVSGGRLLPRLRAHLRSAVVVGHDRFRRQPVALTVGSIGYVAAQVALLWLCLGAAGLHPALAVLVTAAAIERLSSLIPVTPAGVGMAEIGTVAWLVAAGLDPVGVVAGVLLYRLFVVGMEIPVGAVLLTGWVWRRRTGSRVEVRATT